MVDVSDDFNDPGTFDDWSMFDCDNTWLITGGLLHSPSNVDTNMVGTFVNNIPMDTIDQYAQFEMHIGVNNMGIVFRHSFEENANCYYAYANINNGETGFRVYANGSERSGNRWFEQGTLVWQDGDIVGATCTGTGAATVFNYWRNPPGDPANPNTWGPPGLTFNYTSGDTYWDTGFYVGLGQTSRVNEYRYDDFFGGDYSTEEPPGLIVPQAMHHQRQQR